MTNPILRALYDQICAQTADFLTAKEPEILQEINRRRDDIQDGSDTPLKYGLTIKSTANLDKSRITTTITTSGHKIKTANDTQIPDPNQTLPGL